MVIRRSIARTFALALPVACGDASVDDVASTTDTGEDVSSSSGVGSESESGNELESGSSSTVASETSSGSESGGEGMDCPLPPGAPPSAVVDGFTLVPIDAIAVEATLRFELAAEAATGRAELTFVVGPEGGYPIFDLRQTITAIELDGVEMPADSAPFFAGGDDVDARMRVVREELAPCSAHTLVLEYEVAEPDASNSVAPRYEADGVQWASWHADLRPGRYAEQWMPANLPYDELAMTVDIEVVGGLPHVLAANGDVSPVGDGRWHVDFPPYFTALSPMFVLMPEAIVDVASAPVRLPDGDVVTVEVVRDFGAATADLLAATGEALIATNLELGEYLHGDRYLVFSAFGGGGMEYEGATTAESSAIGHEVFHSWIGRGLRPLRHRDGWIDEAWTMFSVQHAFSGEPLTDDDLPVVLAPDDPWIRSTSYDSYSTGSRIFATLAAEIGTDELRGLLREFYGEQTQEGRFVTTEQLEAYLVEAIPSKTPAWLFERFVYGRAGAPD